jgi:hypothetical protein
MSSFIAIWETPVFSPRAAAAGIRPTPILKRTVRTDPGTTTAGIATVPGKAGGAARFADP